MSKNADDLANGTPQSSSEPRAISVEAWREHKFRDAKTTNVVAQSEILGYTLYMATVTETLRKALEQCGQTRYAVGKATGIPASTLSRFVAAGKPLRGENIDKLAAYLGLVLTHKAGKTRKGK
jgi:hypothetical protein